MNGLEAGLEQPIRIVSDLHLGSPGSRVDDVAGLAPVFEGARTVIFNGDTREERIAAIRGQAEESHRQLVEICHSLGINAVFICGNHDPDISEHHYLDLCGGRFFVTHGDLLFPTITPWSSEVDERGEEIECIRRRYGAAADSDLAMAVERLKETRRHLRVYPKLDAREKNGLERFLWIAGELWPPRRLVQILSVWRNTPHLARQFLGTYRPDAECIIMGHTHRSQVSIDRSPHFLNTGTFTFGLGRSVAEIDENRLWIRGVRRSSEGRWFLSKQRRALGN